MNLISAQNKIKLYRRLNEQDTSFRHRDFDNYNEFFTNEKLNQFEDILLEYQEKKLSDVVNSENEFYKLYAAHYKNKLLATKVDLGYKLHFEFNHVLFYELLNYFKSGIEGFLNLLSEIFYIYYVKSENSYYIPFQAYQTFFTELQDEEIKEAIRFLVRTVTYTVVSGNDQFETKIDVSLIKKYLLNLVEYYNQEI